MLAVDFVAAFAAVFAVGVAAVFAVCVAAAFAAHAAVHYYYFVVIVVSFKLRCSTIVSLGRPPLTLSTTYRRSRRNVSRNAGYYHSPETYVDHPDKVLQKTNNFISKCKTFTGGVIVVLQ